MVLCCPMLLFKCRVVILLTILPLLQTVMPQSILQSYGLDVGTALLIPFGNGLINSTWKVVSPDGVYILQRINTAVFKHPFHIATNISFIAQHFGQHHPEYKFVAPIASLSGDELVSGNDNTYYRLFSFVEGSHTKDVVKTPAQAYEAAMQFGRFTRLLKGFDVAELKITIPGFHDLELRYSQFQQSLISGNQLRITEAKQLIQTLISNKGIVGEYVAIKKNPDFKLRVTHHDTKISNVLFDGKDKSICVIDLDTIMPGYFISDVGDMMRTYLCPVSEEESDCSKIEIRDDFYKAIVEGYYAEMKDELTETEKGYFFYAGKFMIYMQALRFLTDYFNDDVYYGEKYAGQNFIRAKNQLVLLQKLMEKK